MRGFLIFIFHRRSFQHPPFYRQADPQGKQLTITKISSIISKDFRFFTKKVRQLKTIDKRLNYLEKLRTSTRADADTGPIWFGFTSPSGKQYRAVHVLNHPLGPYILLSSKDKDHTDFKYVEQLVAINMDTVPERISDRGSDICNVLFFRKIPDGFEKWLLEKFDDFYSKEFSNTVVEVVY